MPPFIVYVAADLYNSKVNLELTFPSHPTMGELQHHIQSVFSAECEALLSGVFEKSGGTRRPLLQRFGIARVQIYSDDGSGEWSDLTTASSLQPYSQIYVFQSDPNYRESQDQIPSARRPACYNGYAPLWTAAAAGKKSKSSNHGVSEGAGKGGDQPSSLTPLPSGINNSRAVTTTVNTHTPPPTPSSSALYTATAGNRRLVGAADDDEEAEAHRRYTEERESRPSSQVRGRPVPSKGMAQPETDYHHYRGSNEDNKDAAEGEEEHYSYRTREVQRRQPPQPLPLHSAPSSKYEDPYHHMYDRREYKEEGNDRMIAHSITDARERERFASDRGVGVGYRRAGAPAAADAAIATVPIAAAVVDTVGRPSASSSSAASSPNTLFFASASSHSDKVALIFEASCRNGARHLLEGDFRALFRDTNMGFAPHVISSLFRQADADRDGVLTLAELQLMLKEYPTLTDALFFRLKDLQEGEVLQQRLAEACIALEERKRKREQILDSDKASSSRVADQLALMKKLEVQWQERLAAENELAKKLAAERSETVAIQEAAAGHNKDMTVMVGRDDSARRFLVDAERETLYCQQQHKKALEIAKVADHRVKELMELLEAAKMEAAQQHRNAEEAAAEVTRAEANEKRAAEQLSAFSSELQRRKTHSERLSDELLAHRRKAEELRRMLDECQSENERLAMSVERNAEELRRLEGGREVCRREVTLAEASISEAEKRVTEADRAIEVFAQRRAATEAKERPLLEQEIRLKEQRLSLDENETLLRREAYNVFDPLARGSASGRQALLPISRAGMGGVMAGDR